MSYKPTEWKSGDTVTSAKLNNIEEGIASSGAFIVHGIISEGTGTITLDKTWKEIHDAAQQEKYVCIIVLINDTVRNLPVLVVGAFDTTFFVGSLHVELGLVQASFTTDSEDGYPTYTPSFIPTPGTR